MYSRNHEVFCIADNNCHLALRTSNRQFCESTETSVTDKSIIFSIEYPFLRYRDEIPEEVHPFLPFYKVFLRTTTKKPEHATKGESNEEGRKLTSHIQKREIDPALTKLAKDKFEDIIEDDTTLYENIQKNKTKHIKEDSVRDRFKENYIKLIMSPVWSMINYIAINYLHDMNLKNVHTS
nr:PREDICTED: uncharacterized protein LOC105677302 [Linepithema humile]